MEEESKKDDSDKLQENSKAVKINEPEKVSMANDELQNTNGETEVKSQNIQPQNQSAVFEESVIKIDTQRHSALSRLSEHVNNFNKKLKN